MKKRDDVDDETPAIEIPEEGWPDTNQPEDQPEYYRKGGPFDTESIGDTALDTKNETEIEAVRKGWPADTEAIEEERSIIETEDTEDVDDTPPWH